MPKAKKALTFDDRVAAVAAALDRSAIGEALSELAAKVVAKRAPASSARTPVPTPRVEARAQRRRTGKVGSRRYTVGKFNDARRGTWRHYMLDTIQAHEDTRSATSAHLTSGKHSDKTLDFAWAAREGYITFI